MAYLLRVILLAVFFSSPAHALIPKTDSGTCQSNYSGSRVFGQKYGGCGGFTDGGFTAVQDGVSGDGTVLCHGGSNCIGHGVTMMEQWSFVRAPACPENSSVSAEDNNKCACNAGYVEKGGSFCEKVAEAGSLEKACADLAKDGVKWRNMEVQKPVGVSGVSITSVCARDLYWSPDSFPGKGCTLSYEWSWSGSHGDGVISHFGTGTPTAAPCTMDNGDSNKEQDEKDKAEKAKCANGYSGTVNGVQTCVPFAEKTGVDGSTKETTENGKKTTVKTDNTTTCTGNTCKTTTTTTTTTTNISTGASTTTTKTTETTGSLTDYCAQKPEAGLCGGSGGKGNENGDGEDGSEFGGSCSGGFTCAGDAIQCAIAKEQHKRACKLFDDKNDASTSYEEEAKKEATRDVTKDLAGNEEVDIASKLRRDNLLGSGQCIRDLQVTVHGSSITLPLSGLCSHLQVLGNILIAIASLAAARIIMKA